jgi:hypothetical protein
VELGGRPLVTGSEDETVVFTGLWYEDALLYFGALVEVGEHVFLYRDIVGELRG